MNESYTKEPYTLEQLVRLAKRDNNTKRPYLYVNPLQGKHIPVRPSEAIKVFQALGAKVSERFAGEKLLTVGFAETATAVGFGVAGFCPEVIFCQQTTREAIENAVFLDFTESHSHATSQELAVNDWEEALKQAERIVFVEDEVTTGNTILKIVNLIKERFGMYGPKFAIASLLNSMEPSRLAEVEAMGIPCIFLCPMEKEYHVDTLSRFAYEPERLVDAGKLAAEKGRSEAFLSGWKNSRLLMDKEEYMERCRRFAKEAAAICEKMSEKISGPVSQQNDSQQAPGRVPEQSLGRLSGANPEKRVLVLGTEEFMYAPLLAAKAIEDSGKWAEVRFHATTRSPILASGGEDYPLFVRYAMESLYEPGRNTFVYNLSHYDLVLIATDAHPVNETGKIQLLAALEAAGCQNICFLVWGEEKKPV